MVQIIPRVSHGYCCHRPLGIGGWIEDEGDEEKLLGPSNRFSERHAYGVVLLPLELNSVRTLSLKE